jgi:hypothetical protein
MGADPTLVELEAEARHALSRVALERQRLYAGRGTERRLAELERVAAGASERLRRRRLHDRPVADADAERPAS